ncbi:hypothetical protein NHX12_028264 [Muraenolepis orangiensis]|uniref:Uncharacterized protein n=1 Tax=Muraenolepis orangiensis TaxID=630683 RepID=A0A9Q0ILZ4_9TELE|nr:hypothetical protein NHX12_028264 [Muraenolepis orangiensis]
MSTDVLSCESMNEGRLFKKVEAGLWEDRLFKKVEAGLWEDRLFKKVEAGLWEDRLFKKVEAGLWEDRLFKKVEAGLWEDRLFKKVEAGLWEDRLFKKVEAGLLGAQWAVLCVGCLSLEVGSSISVSPPGYGAGRLERPYINSISSIIHPPSGMTTRKKDGWKTNSPILIPPLIGPS